jgi:hypothetical protein
MKIGARTEPSTCKAYVPRCPVSMYRAGMVTGTAIEANTASWKRRTRSGLPLVAIAPKSRTVTFPAVTSLEPT